MFIKFHYGSPQEIYPGLAIVGFSCFMTAAYGCCCSIAVVAYGYVVPGMNRWIFLFKPSNALINLVELFGAPFFGYPFLDTLYTLLETL